jgi:FlaA1/EpsC-like NDP-sugar epimerase
VFIVLKEFQDLLVFAANVIIFWFIGSRLAIKYIINDNYSLKKNFNKKNVFVYGAGESGRQLVIALENSPEFKVVGFLMIIKIYIDSFIRKNNIFT